MNFARVKAIANALLYEGYMLYPYRPSALKNQQRWLFGVLHPREQARAPSGSEPWRLQSECLLMAGPTSHVEVKVRFLHPVAGETGGWQDALPCEVDVAPIGIADLASQPVHHAFARGAGPRGRVEGAVELAAADVEPGIYKLTVRVLNLTPVEPGDAGDLDQRYGHSMVSTQAVLGLQNGEFVPPRDPPPLLCAAADACRNVGLWPILVGEPGARDLLLCSPIILDDYPQVAPESPGDLFDSTEIDELLTLRILTLTPEEKREMGAIDERVRALLARTEALEPAQLARLHGVLRARRATAASPGPNRTWSEHEDGGGALNRDPRDEEDALSIELPRKLRVGPRAVGPGDRVRLRPHGRSDIFDLALAGRTATIVAVEQDYEERSYVVVTVDDDPGRDLGAAGQAGHRFFFRPEEIELLAPPGQVQ